MNDPTQLVLNLRFTGDLDRHESEVRTVWGGPLCISPAERTEAELQEIQASLTDEVDGVLGAWREARTDQVVLLVILAEPGLRESLDERFGPDVVIVVDRLQKIED